MAFIKHKLSKRAVVIVYQEDSYNSLFDAMFGDLRNNPDVFFIIEKSLPEKGIYRILPSRKLKKLTFGLSDKLYSHYYNLPKILKKLNKEYGHVSVLFHNASIIKPRYPIELFQLLHKQASFNLLYIDTYDSVYVCNHANYLFENKVFDKTFTIDPLDAQRHQMELCISPYSKITLTKETKTKKQVYFCGGDTGRLYTLYCLWKEAKDNNVPVVFDLVNFWKYREFFDGDTNVRMIEHIPYNQVLENILVSSCILDITKEGQSALTIRPYEAVVYNKKLLTNNKNIKHFKYYNEKYMQYFKKVEDINWEWVLEECQIDYKYSGDFSPELLLERLV